MVLEINNSHSRIRNATPAQEKAIRNRLSYVVGGKSAYYTGYGPKRRSLVDKQGYFPTGLGSSLVAHLLSEKIDFQIKDLRVKPKVLNNIMSQGYNWQTKAVNAALAASRGTISAPTGTGKSRAIRMLLERFNLKALVVVPSLEIKKQMQETLKDTPSVTVENIDSKALKTARDFDVLIIDEAHHVAAKTYQKLNKTVWTNIYYRFFFTATAFRNDNEEQLLFESIAGQVIYSLDYRTAVTCKYIVPIEAYYLEMPKQKTDAYTWAEVYSQLVVRNDGRNEALALLLLRLNAQRIPTLLLVKEVAHGKAVAALTGLPFVHGTDESSRQYIRQFNDGGIKVLIGTTGILGEGVDTKPCEYVIVAGLGKAKSQFMQAIGRAVRTYPSKESAKVVIIKDSSHKFTLRHFKEQAKILKEEYGVIPSKLEL